MPTFNDPLSDAEEAYEALRGLAHASAVFDEPADTYQVLGELLGGLRALPQVLHQIADAHLRHEGWARTDDGNIAAGQEAVIAAADALHEAAARIETAEELVDRAKAASGRIAWRRPEPAVPEREGTQAGIGESVAGRLGSGDPFSQPRRSNGVPASSRGLSL